MIAEIDRRYDRLRESLTRQLREAKNGEKAAEIRGRIEEEGAERRKELREATMEGKGDGMGW